MSARRLSHALALAALALCAASPRTAHADGARAEDAHAATRVLIVATTATPLTQTLGNELAAARYDVDYSFGQSWDVEPRDVRARAIARDARVLLRSSEDGTAVELWVADHDGEVVRFRERITAGDASAGPDVLAIRAHEAMRAALLEVSDAPRPSPPPATSGDAAPVFEAAPTVPRFAASVGPALVASPGGVSASASAALGFAWMPSDHWSFDARATLPLVSGRVSAPEGTARVGVTSLGAGASWIVTSRASAVRPSLGVGAALVWVHVDGVATPPFVSNTDDVVAPIPYARAAVSIALGGRMRLAFDALAGVTLPESRVSFGGREVASLGAPLFIAASSIEATW